MILFFLHSLSCIPVAFPRPQYLEYWFALSW